MSLRTCVLASGSSGNCVYVASDTTRVLIDAGLSCRQIESRMRDIGEDIARIQAVCVTHEHDDHRAALAVLHKRVQPALFANSGTVQALSRHSRLAELPWNIFATGVPFEIGDLRVEPFCVPHDSYDPVGFVVSHGEASLGVVTDMGTVTGLIRERLRNCGVVVVEANHDEELLRDSSRPWALKQRIAGRQGHLSNREAAGLLADIAQPALRVAFLAHMSAECNKPGIAVQTVRQVLEERGCGHVEVKLTYAGKPSELVSF